MENKQSTIQDQDTIQALEQLETQISLAYSRLEQFFHHIQDHEVAKELVQTIQHCQEDLKYSQEECEKSIEKIQKQEQSLEQLFYQSQNHQQKLQSINEQAQQAIEILTPLVEKLQEMGGSALPEQLATLQTALETSESALSKTHQDFYQPISAEIHQLSGQLSRLRQTNKRLMFAILAIGAIAMIGLLT